MEKDQIEFLINRLTERNIEGFFYETFEEAKSSVLERIPINASVGIGNSVTLKNLKISKELKDRGNIVFDKTIAKNREESKELKRKSLLTDWYITGTNAISLDGHLVNVDHSGNRVAAMLYGPNKVIIIIGANKITNTLDEAIFRVRNIASPQNARRAGFNPPCVELEKCIDCRSKQRVCNSLVIIEGQNEKDRMKVFIVNDNDGF